MAQLGKITQFQKIINPTVEEKLKGHKTYKVISEEFGVPQSVIFNRIKGRSTSMLCTKSGRRPVLDSNIESVLVNCIVARAQMGYPCDKEELQCLVQEYIVANGIQNPFNNNKPGNDWYYSFMKRNPKLNFKKPEQLQKLRKDARKPEIIYHFYSNLENICQEKLLISQFVFNADESGFRTDPSRLKAIGEKGKALSRVTGGSGRESISVLACISADGLYLPPLIIFKGMAVQARWTSEKSFPGTLYAVSKNGWMEEPVFYNWFENAFVPFVIKKRKDLGTNSNALLLYDGHCSHISMRIIELAMKNNITLFKFPSHLTDRLQPLDKCVFGPLKSVWDKELIHFGKTMIGKGPGRLTKAMFSELLGKAWSVGMKSENIISGFRTTGVFPVDKNKFPLTEFDPNELNYYLRIEAEKQNKILHSAIEPSSSTSRNILTEPNEHIELSASNDSITQCESTSLNEIIISDNIDSSPLLPHTPLSDGNHNINNLLSDKTTSSPTDIIGIFTKHLGQLKAMTSSPRESKDPTPRLKTARYGEVLTNETVLMRLKEVTEKLVLNRQFLYKILRL
ncbi:tigger transposable element-derived protein 2-like [Acyrthosiphon pisum]|uniref:DDE-1 domain-containing protein n=1 Tax=Acyrthosiphon pisum TaxID=7029 RepID=A0A8R2NTK0_ACYPI|nr:tigger transposable element-derived protein 2-like [Acyrthosiphon pisum]